MRNHRLKRYIINGNIILYPTESCFGIGCDPSNFFSIQKIKKIKKRNLKKNFLLIGSNMQEFKKYIIEIKNKDLKELYSKWPGPHTWVVDAKKNTSPWLSSSQKKIAIRIPSFSLCHKLTKGIGMALISTSANESGKRSIKNYRQACRFGNGRVKIIKGVIGGMKKPSTIQDFTSKQILRK
ncbi:MAG: Sua5/YciO/YrdC/YwlC family protein [Methylophilaceae bacterium]|nr:Sua5/YciO/YrdC/YwlC family protein [Methylophilaceae bacterium]MBL6726960.1 Sua5/YciO/YrdC/YwlC family protein [Methylophilaceae bacterium]MBL6728667.1 Sua5/YciO/YrdC/YwlC family protein [Methylophilaceae bacterium]MBL6791453.1 Sua5/YciO/YrdC/YwlC family protein [Methylophilaceae bacterium]